jgi:hypothetical protein
MQTQIQPSEQRNQSINEAARDTPRETELTLEPWGRAVPDGGEPDKGEKDGFGWTA